MIIVFLAKANPAAAVFGVTVGGPAVRRSGQTLPVLLDRPRFNTQRSSLTTKGPAHTRLLPQVAQPCRPPDQQVSAHLSNV